LRRWRDPLIVALAAVLVRGIYLLQAAHGPAFAEPMVDAQTYHDLAVGLARGGVYDARMLWQAPLYPVFLAGIYKVCGISIVAAKVVQAALGVGTALLTWSAGRRVGSPAVGLAAGLMVAFAGVLVFFEAELLGTGLAAFWAVLLLDLLLAARAQARRRTLLAVGVVSAFAILTRPDLAPCAAVGLVWLAWKHTRRGALALAGVVVVLWPVAAFNTARTGHAGLLPPSGGINLYIGNHPEFDRTIAIRPGLPWEELIATPVRETRIDDPWVSQRWFRREVARFLRDDPTGFAARLGEKALHAVSSRELTRNVDVYLFREWSSLLSMLVWKAGRFGFPFGALLPLAVAGCVLARRRLPAVVWLLPAVHLAGLALVFVAARYRVVGTPWLAVPAAWALVEGWSEVRRRNWRLLAPAAAAAVVVLILATVPGPFVQESIDTEPEMWHSIGINRLHRDNDLTGAEAAFRHAVTLRPDFPEAQNRLGVAIARQGRFEESIPHFEAAIAWWPAYDEARRNLQNAKELAGK
jgi:4-amino-4-deoxy-L-arabinose transferase-like glycosyltransferase